MRTRKILIGAALAVFVSGGAMAADNTPLGRDIARDGGLTSLHGELVRQEGEWYIRSGSELTQLHMGRYGHSNESFLSAQGSISTTGFSVPGHIAPIQVSGSTDTVEFWNQARYPNWAGEGERRNEVEQRLGRTDTRDDDVRHLGVGATATAGPTQTRAVVQERNERTDRAPARAQDTRRVQDTRPAPSRRR